MNTAVFPSSYPKCFPSFCSVISIQLVLRSICYNLVSYRSKRSKAAAPGCVASSGRYALQNENGSKGILVNLAAAKTSFKVLIRDAEVNQKRRARRLNSENADNGTAVPCI